MINTWNPAELNQKINQLEAIIKAQDVEANPTGEATETLTKIGIDGDIYSFTAETTAADVSYDNTASGLTADDVQDAIDEIVANPVITKIEVTASTNASGKITLSATDVPLDKLVSVIVKSPTGYNVLPYRGSSAYGVIVTEQGTVTPVASTECVLEIAKLS